MIEEITNTSIDEYKKNWGDLWEDALIRDRTRRATRRIKINKLFGETKHIILHGFFYKSR